MHFNVLLVESIVHLHSCFVFFPCVCYDQGVTERETLLSMASPE